MLIVMEPTHSPAEAATRIFSALGERDLTIFQTTNHPDVVDDFVAVGEFRGVDAVRGFFAEIFAAFPDFDIEAVQMVGDAEHAVVQWHATGTFTGRPFQGIHATGRRI
jgi:predicted ester cyclase